MRFFRKNKAKANKESRVTNLGKIEIQEDFKVSDLESLTFDEYNLLISRSSLSIHNQRLVLNDLKDNPRFTREERSTLIRALNTKTAETLEKNVDFLFPFQISFVIQEFTDQLRDTLRYITGEERNLLKLQLSRLKEKESRYSSMIEESAGRILQVLKKRFSQRSKKTIHDNLNDYEIKSVKELLRGGDCSASLGEFIFPKFPFWGNEAAHTRHQQSMEQRKRSIILIHQKLLEGLEIEIEPVDPKSIAITIALVWYLKWLESRFVGQDKPPLHFIIEAARNLQERKMFLISSGSRKEDARNNLIADFLERSKWEISSKDQSLMGVSKTGKSIGEVDIRICQGGATIAVIEGMNLNSLNSLEIKKHVNSIFGYDQSGMPENYLLIYSEAKRFETLWNKYVTFIAESEFDFPIQESPSIVDSGFSEIKILEVIHNRNSRPLKIIHLFINLQLGTDQE